MTENEAIQVFKELLDVPCEMLVKYDSVTTEEQKNALVKIRVAEDMAIQALEEIQQYRAIGLTPTMVKDLIKSCKKHEKNALENAHIVDDYREIGTIEEFKALKEKNEPKKQGNVNDKESHLILDNAGFLCCAVTGKAIRYPLISIRDLEYCPCCGQKLDWQ